MGQSFHDVSRRILRAIPSSSGATEQVEPTAPEPGRTVLGGSPAWQLFAAGSGVIATVVFIATMVATGSILAALAIAAFCGGIAVAATLAYRGVRADATRLFGELEELSSRDALTGALNKSAFERTFQGWVGNGMRRRIESALLLVDIDQLQRINDQHGHEAGDAALRHLSTIVYECIRGTDAFGRLQGGEFGLLFPATSGPEATIAAERIRAIVARRSAESGVPFTISVGVTGGHSFSDPWAAAQRALELAKAAGSNRVVLAETETQAEPEFEELPFAA